LQPYIVDSAMWCYFKNYFVNLFKKKEKKENVINTFSLPTTRPPPPHTHTHIVYRIRNHFNEHVSNFLLVVINLSLSMNFNIMIARTLANEKM